MRKRILLSIFCITAIGTLAACGNDKKTAESKEINSTIESNQSTKQESSTTKIEGLSEQTFKVSLDEAITLFTDKYPDAVITSIEFDKSFGQYRYSIEGVNDSKEYELNVNPNTKEMTEKEELLDVEDANGRKKENDSLRLKNIISPQEAMQKALNITKNKGNITEWAIENKKQRTYFEIKINDNHIETEIKISADNGEILSIEKDD